MRQQSLWPSSCHLYSFCCLPFRSSLASEAFQRTMETIFSDTEGVECYMDNILVQTDSKEEHDMCREWVPIIWSRLDWSWIRTSMNSTKTTPTSFVRYSAWMGSNLTPWSWTLLGIWTLCFWTELVQGVITTWTALSWSFNIDKLFLRPDIQWLQRPLQAMAVMTCSQWWLALSDDLPSVMTCSQWRTCSQWKTCSQWRTCCQWQRRTCSHKYRHWHFPTWTERQLGVVNNWSTLFLGQLTQTDLCKAIPWLWGQLQAAAVKDSLSQEPTLVH